MSAVLTCKTFSNCLFFNVMLTSKNEFKCDSWMEVVSTTCFNETPPNSQIKFISSKNLHHMRLSMHASRGNSASVSKFQNDMKHWNLTINISFRKLFTAWRTKNFRGWVCLSSDEFFPRLQLKNWKYRLYLFKTRAKRTKVLRRTFLSILSFKTTWKP